MTPSERDLVRLIGDPRTCTVRESEEAEGFFDVLSPAVGYYDRPPAVGTFVRPGSFVGYLTVLRHYFHLMVPEGHHGVVTEVYITNRKQQVEHGQRLFRVSPETSSIVDVEDEKKKSGKAVSKEGVPEGMYGIKSPTDGIFYRKPNPQSPNYTEEGSLVKQGTVLALVEVMKCFNHIVYPGEPEFPPQGKIKRIVPKDSSEVNHGSVLFIIEPA
jgi:biotin carboxyl carrier protein